MFPHRENLPELTLRTCVVKRQLGYLESGYYGCQFSNFFVATLREGLRRDFLYSYYIRRNRTQAFEWHQFQ